MASAATHHLGGRIAVLGGREAWALAVLIIKVIVARDLLWIDGEKRTEFLLACRRPVVDPIGRNLFSFPSWSIG